MTTWQADGWDARFRVGVLTPHSDVGPEAELHAMVPPGVSIHAARIPFAGGGIAAARAFGEPPHADDAAGLLAGAPLDAITFGFTSTAYVGGAAAEAALVARLQQRTGDIPVIMPCAAAVGALQILGCHRIALFDPPWFDAALNDLGRRYYAGAGFDVVYSASVGLARVRQAITPDDLHAWAVAQMPDRAQALVIGGNGLRAVGVVAALEAELQRPVLTANQVLLWAALRVAGADPRAVTRYGRIFAVTAS